MAIELILQEAQGLSEESLMEVLRFMRFIKAESGTAESAEERTPVRRAGLYRGQIWAADDFDAPLDEFKEYV